MTTEILYRARANTDATVLLLRGMPIAFVEAPDDESAGYYQEIPEGHYVRNRHEGYCWYVQAGELHATSTEPTHLTQMEIADGNHEIVYYGDEIAELLGIEAPEADDGDEDAPVYTYRTDATHCDTEYASEAEAIDAAIGDGEWAPIGSGQEARDIADGAWLCIYEDGVPVTTRGTMA